MNTSSTRHWRRALFLTGMSLSLVGALLYSIERINRPYAALLHQADTYYESQQYHQAIAAYERVLERAATPTVRASTLLVGRLVSPAGVLLQMANCHYRLAEAALRHYRQAVRDPRITPRPSLATVQHLLTMAGKAYEEVPQTDPPAYMAAQVNITRVAAWRLLLAAFDEQTAGRRSIRQQALQAIRYAATAVDFAHNHREQIGRQERMTAMLLLETLTAFSQEKPPPRPPVDSSDALRGRLGDLLLQDTPELSSQERQRFQQFFFALPLEAKDPWPIGRQGGAGGGRSRIAH
jgi:tetratricopeptide (TPR) repeat protein